MLGAEHEQIFVDVQSGGTASAEYREINPMRKVPTLVDDGVVVTEVAAICAYLADKYPEKGLASPTDKVAAYVGRIKDRAAYQQSHDSGRH